MNCRWTSVFLASCATLGVLSVATNASAESWMYVMEGTPLVYLRGHQTPPPQWPTSAFDASSWTASASGFGIGYGDGDDNTVLADMADSFMTVYVRAHFTVGNELPSIQHVTLESRFDDGFVAYLNGTEIGRASVPPGPLQASTTASGHEVSDGPAVFHIDPALLVAGDNVLAVEVHNTSLGSSDLSFIPKLFADDGTPSPQVTIRRGPFLQQVERRSAIVVWETFEPAPSILRFGKSPQDMQNVVSLPDAVTHHVVELHDLDPATTYHFNVDSLNPPLPPGQFTTVVNTADPYRILVFGDTRSNHADHASVITAMATENAAAVFHSGDLVASGSSDSDWDKFFEVERPLLMRVPLYPAMGNHEGEGDIYRDIFELAPPERYYAVRIATTLVLNLDLYTSDFDPPSEQYAWLEQQLAAAEHDVNIRQRLVLLHHGPYDSGSHDSNLSVRNDLVPLFEQYGVDMVFSGHDHDYERSTVNGIKYAVSGGGGAPLYSVNGDWWTEVSASELHYVLLEIHGAKTVFTAKRPNGSVLDSFVLGDDVSECSAPADCESQQPGSCETDEVGAWACVEGACLWNCVKPPEEPDGGPGPDGSASPDGSVAPDGSILPDGAVHDSGGGAGVAGHGPTPPGASSGDDGCGCRQAGANAGSAAAALVALGAAFLGAGRRRRRNRV